MPTKKPPAKTYSGPRSSGSVSRNTAPDEPVVYDGRRSVWVVVTTMLAALCSTSTDRRSTPWPRSFGSETPMPSALAGRAWVRARAETARVAALRKVLRMVLVRSLVGPRDGDVHGDAATRAEVASVRTCDWHDPLLMHDPTDPRSRVAALTQRRHTVAAWLVHAYTASGVVLAFLMFIAVMEGDTVRGAVALPRRHGRRRHGRHARALGPGEAPRPVVRRRAAGQHRRLHHLRLHADGAAVERRLPRRGHVGHGARGRSRCSPRPTSSAGSTRRPTTTCSSASRATGTSPRSTSWSSTSQPTRGRRRAAGVRGPRVRADRLRLPVAHDHAEGTTLALTALWLVGYAVLLTQLPDPSPVWLAISVAYVAYYVALSLLPDGPARSPRAGRRVTTDPPCMPYVDHLAEIDVLGPAYGDLQRQEPGVLAREHRGGELRVTDPRRTGTTPQ